MDDLKVMKLQIQELRQFCIHMILSMRNNGLSEQACDHWWEKLTSYPKVETDD